MYSKIGTYNHGHVGNVFTESLKPLKASSWKKIVSYSLSLQKISSSMSVF